MTNSILERKVVHVAVAVIRGEDGRLLIAKRPDDKHMGGLWEFPGGKVETGENVQNALRRELKEELAVQVTEFSPLIQIRHHYPDKSVHLDTWIVSGLLGQAVGNEGQEIRWVKPEELVQFAFPEANKPIVNAVLLPDQYMITGKFDVESELFEKVTKAINEGVALIQFRAPWLSRGSYLDIAKRLSAYAKEKQTRLIVKGDLDLISEDWCQGIHLTSGQLRDLKGLKVHHEGKWLAASCHDLTELNLAVKSGMDFATLSPINETSSHKGAELLGIEAAAVLVEEIAMPVYLLGGMDLTSLEAAQKAGAQGVAAISAFWH